MHTTPNVNISTTSSTPTRKLDWDLAVILWLAFGIIGLVLNVLEFIILIRKKKYATQFGVNLISLSLADTMACLSYCFYSATMISIYTGLSTVNSSTFQARAISQILIFSTITITFIHIVLIAIQRLYAVLSPYTFPHKFTLRNTIALLIIAWIIGAAYCIGFIFSRTFAEIASYQIFIIGTALIFIYCIITHKTGRKPGRRGSLVHSNHNRRIFLHSIGVTFVFAICNFPYAVNFLFFSNHKAVRKYFYALLMVRPLFDPVIYFFLYRAWERNRARGTTICHIAPSRTEMNETNH